MAGAITAEDRSFTEEWENISIPSYAIIKYDVQGGLVHQVIEGRRRFHVTTAERKVTQERILRVEDDPFLNGAFRPIVVPDSVTVTTNPNALSDDEIHSILVSSDIAWDEWMKVIDSPGTIGRMMDMAGEIDGITLSRYRQLATRLAELRPVQQITSKDQKHFDEMRPK